MRPAAADLLALKRRWVPLFLLGTACFGAGLTLFLLRLYRSSPLVEVVVGLLTTPARGAPARGTLISAAAAMLTLLGGTLMLASIRRINASEVGEIDSFWWKVAVASLASRWWLGDPHIVLIAGDEPLLDLVRALKSFTGRVTVLLPENSEAASVYLALAEDEAAMADLWPALAPLERPTGALSPVLRLRGRVAVARPAPRTLEALIRADAIVIGAGGDQVLEAHGIAAAVRGSRARKVLVPPVAAEAEGAALAEWMQPVVERVGQPDVVLVNNNYAPEGVRFVRGAGEPGEVMRDLLDWANPTRPDPTKLGVFLREVILR